jgi:undecaprenyl diphosphate synthase
MDQHTPQHIAIIMDGNRRWAKEKHLPVIEGHRRVANQVLEPLVEHAAKKGVKYITFWAWSTENWKRTEEEVQGIMQLFRYVLEKKLQRFIEKGVKIKIIGNTDIFDDDIKKMLHNAIEKTQQNTVITIVFALNYGGRDEILRAVNKLKMNKKLDQSTITMKDIEQELDTSGIPDPDVIIRTGGEQRLSGFLLWQSNYSEFYFPKWYMPEFTTKRLDEAIEEFSIRKRNFGK